MIVSELMLKIVCPAQVDAKPDVSSSFVKDYFYLSVTMTLKIISQSLLILFFIGCNNTTETKAVTLSEDFKYVPLEDFKYKPADISPGTEVEILANLDGPKNSGDTVFYYQFIVLNKNNGDTVRILCPEITVDEDAGIEGKTSTTPLLFDISKGVTTAFFELIDSSKSLLLNGDNMERLATTNDSATIDHLLSPSNAIKIVVLDKNDSEDRIFRFKTIVGVLNFKKIPWGS